MKGKIFNTQEMQAILNGSKVMFREVVKPQPPRNYGSPKHYFEKDGIGYFCLTSPALLGTHHAKCPYQVGQKIFCKESFAEVEIGAGMGYNSGKQTLYKAVDDYDVKWKPAQHMKQEYSRLILLIKSIGVERLQDITCADYFKETGRRPISHMNLDCDTPDPRNDFATYWNATHKKPGEKFEANPFVWKVEMEVVK